MVKYLKRKHKEAFNEFMAEEGISLLGRMDAYKVAAMFKAGRVSGQPSRRGLLRVLRNHFGTKAFDPERKLDMLWVRHSEVHIDIISYAYEDSNIPVTIDYLQKT